MWVYWVQLGFLFPLRVLFRPLKAVLEANLTFWRSFNLRSLFQLPICTIWQLENGPFETRSCFQGQTLLQIEIRSWSNGVCHSCCISFRWHFWHIHFIRNHFIMKNKVLWSYHGWNSEKRLTVANYLVTFQATKTHLFLLAFLFKEFSLMFPIFRKHHNHKAANNHTFNFVTPC